MWEAAGHFLEAYNLVWLSDYDWAWPICEMIHFLGMALLIGSIGLLDFRILGLGKGLPLASLEALVPIGIAGFVANLTTGIIFVLANPTGGPVAYLTNMAFQIKMILILIAGLNAIAFYVAGVSRQLATLGPMDDAPVNAKLIAVASLALWFGVIVFGRLIMYNDTLLWFLGL
ncbi:MAG: hypothetical protein ACWGPN_14270 [Gammaproteobacteria bacterium]